MQSDNKEFQPSSTSPENPPRIKAQVASWIEFIRNKGFKPNTPPVHVRCKGCSESIEIRIRLLGSIQGKLEQFFRDHNGHGGYILRSGDEKWDLPIDKEMDFDKAEPATIDTEITSIPSPPPVESPSLQPYQPEESGTLMENVDEKNLISNDNLLFIAQIPDLAEQIIKFGLNAEENPLLHGEKPSSYERRFEGKSIIILSNGSYDGSLYADALQSSLWPNSKVTQIILSYENLSHLSKDELLSLVEKHRESDSQKIRRPGVDLHLTTLKDISQHKSPQFVITGMVVKGWVHLFTGPQGECKSSTSLEIAKSILTGEPLFGKFPVCIKGPVLIIDEENPGSLLRDRTKKMGFDANLPLYFLHFQEVRVDHDDCFDSLMSMIEKVNPVLVMFDSLIRIHKQDENVSSKMALVMGRIRMIANRGYTCWIIHHQGHPKNGPKRSKSRGSTDIVAGVDLEYSVKKSGDVLTIESGKTRIEKFGPIKLNLKVTDDKMEITYAGESRGEFDDTARSETLITLKHGGKKMIFGEVWEDLKNRAKIRIGQNKLRSILNDFYKEGTINREEQKDGKKRQFAFWLNNGH